MTTPAHAFDDDELPGINAIRWGCITTDGTAFEVPDAYLKANSVRGLLAFLDEALYTVCALWVRDAEDAALALVLGQAIGGIEDVIVMPSLPRALPVNEAPTGLPAPPGRYSSRTTGNSAHRAFGCERAVDVPLTKRCDALAMGTVKRLEETPAFRIEDAGGRFCFRRGLC